MWGSREVVGKRAKSKAKAGASVPAGAGRGKGTAKVGFTAVVSSSSHRPGLLGLRAFRVSPAQVGPPSAVRNLLSFLFILFPLGKYQVQRVHSSFMLRKKKVLVATKKKHPSCSQKRKSLLKGRCVSDQAYTKHTQKFSCVNMTVSSMHKNTQKDTQKKKYRCVHF